MMFQQSGGRGQRPKGFRVKRALQFGLLLAVCIWVFYKLQHFNKKASSNVDSAERRISEVSQTVELGRKGKAGTNAGIVEVFRDRNGPSGVEDIGEREEVGADGNNDLDKNVVEVNEDLMGSVVSGEGENEEEIETQEGDSQRSGDPIDVKDENVEFSDTNEKDMNEDNADENVMNHDKEVDEKELNKDENEAIGADIGEKETEKELNRREEDSEGNEIDNRDERMDLSSQDGSVDKMQIQPSQRETTSAADASKTEDGVDSFQDFNGIPPDGLQLVKSSPNADEADEPNASSDQETIPSSDNETSHGEDTTIYEDIDKSSELDGGVDDEVQFSKKVTDSENNEGSDPLQELISLSRTTEPANEPSNTNIADA
ncbi:high mobility group nucleosome-binding domain-containing protein 5-like [Papaver somniferum]|uniref:high mobility group nucleosome-binding domain-containing protein 5-like n=1 Tax=Papaver somniferum TaxID=3469 RepID=UPI000E6F6B83|nr:high mobility group nucleosome-binding domain-containing protein 5-like [Papaver somniferum]